MADEIEFINSRGEKTYLPENVGESMGLQRASDFVPPESIAKPAAGTSTGSSKVGLTFGEAIDVLHGFVDVAGDMDKTPELEVELESLANDILAYVGKSAAIEGQDEKTGAPSLVDAIVVVETQIDADNSKTPAQKKTLKKHLQELLDAAPGDSTPPADTPPAE